jgi:hypothetical protein
MHGAVLAVGARPYLLDRQGQSGRAVSHDQPWRGESADCEVAPELQPVLFGLTRSTCRSAVKERRRAAWHAHETRPGANVRNRGSLKARVTVSRWSADVRVQECAVRVRDPILGRARRPGSSRRPTGPPKPRVRLRRFAVELRPRAPVARSAPGGRSAAETGTPFHRDSASESQRPSEPRAAPRRAGRGLAGAVAVLPLGTGNVVSSTLEQLKWNNSAKPHRKEATHGNLDQRHVHLARRIRHRPQ